MQAVNRLNNCPTYHVPPETINDVALKHPVGGNHSGELDTPAVFGNGPKRLLFLVRSHYPFLARIEDGLGDFQFTREPWTGIATDISKYGLEAGLAICLLGQQRRFLLVRLEDVAAADKGVDAVVVALVEVVDVAVVVTLGAGQVHTEKFSAQIARDKVGFSIPIHDEFCRRTRSLGGGGVAVTIGNKHLTGELVPGFIGGKRLPQILLPLGCLYVLVSTTLHQRHVEGQRQVTRVIRGTEQPVNDLGALVSGLVIQERAYPGGRGDAPGEIKVDASKKFAISGRSGHGTNLPCSQKLIDTHMQRLYRRSQQGQPKQGTQDISGPTHKLPFYWRVA